MSAVGDEPRQAIAAPYPGLRSFESYESALFCGRDKQVSAIVALLRRHRFVVVTGESGCGKSSIVRAGVVPKLYGGALGSVGDVWVEAYFRPGKDPLGNLAAALAATLVPEQASRDVEDVRELLAKPDGIARFRSEREDRLALGGDLDAPHRPAGPDGDPVDGAEEDRCLMRRSANLLIIADQFEEVFNEFNDRSTAAELLVTRLLELFAWNALPPEGGQRPRGAERVFVLLTMRSEYLGRCAIYRTMPDVLNQAAFFVSRLSRSDLMAAAIEPLQAWKLEATLAVEPDEAFVDVAIDGETVEELLDAAILIKEDRDHLPLFQHALAHLWWLARDETDAAGARVAIDQTLLARAARMDDGRDHDQGEDVLAQCLQAHADEVYAALDPREQRIAQIMLRRMATMEPSGNVVRRLATAGDVAACAGCDESEVNAVVRSLMAVRHEFVQLRRIAGMPEELIDLSHEALIRKWSKLWGWVKDEDESARWFADLLERAERWARSGAGPRNVLRDDDLVRARKWRQTVRLYRRSPQALAAWASRYGSAQGSWTERFGGPVGAFERFYRQSMLERRAERQERLRQLRFSAQMEAEVKRARAETDRAEAERQRARAEAEMAEAQQRQAAAERDAKLWRLGLVASLATAAFALLAGGFPWYFVSMAEQRRLVAEQKQLLQKQERLIADKDRLIADNRRLAEMSELYASALANSNLELGRQPPQRRAAVHHELAVILRRIEQLREASLPPDAKELLRTLERSVDSAARQALEATVIGATGAEPPSRDSQADERVRNCIFRADPGKRREVRQVALLPQPSVASAPGRRAYAVLSRLNNVPTVEVFYYRALPRGGCSLGMDGVALSVPTVDDVIMDAAGRWLIEQPRRSANTSAIGARLHRLDWFEVCGRVGKEGSCDPKDRRWRVEEILLGQYSGWQEAERPSLPDGMPAPKPVATAGTGDLAALIQPPPEGFEVREQPTGPNEFGESGGSELFWGDARLSSKAQPGYRIAAYGQRGDLVAFLVSVRAANATRPRAERADAVCGGSELCQHVLRVVRVAPGADADPATAAIPIAEVQFVGPPVDGVGFGAGVLEGDLVLRFAETGGFATVSLGGAKFREWLCRSRDPEAVPEPKFFSQAFRNYVKTQHGGYDRIGAVVDAACG